jgi:hypothetical protein
MVAVGVRLAIEKVGQMARAQFIEEDANGDVLGGSQELIADLGVHGLDGLFLDAHPVCLLNEPAARLPRDGMTHDFKPRRAANLIGRASAGE